MSLREEECSFLIRTVQASTIKVLIEALKEILTDTVFEISEKGIKICTMDSTHTILIHLRLDSENFEEYHCLSKTFIGINMLNLNKIIKTINNNDTISFFMQKDNCNVLGIKIDNSEKHASRVTYMNLLDLENNNIEIPSATFNSVITLPSGDFQKICRDINGFADFLEIKNINSQLILSCTGDFIQSHEITISDGDQITVSHSEMNEKEIFQGIFNLKYLVLFTKCTNLSNTVELYLKNDYPLIVRYSVGSLGEIKLCLAPQTNN